LKNFNKFKIKDHFVLNIITSLAVYSSLEALKIPNLRVKWPNDILSGSQKICGILPENIIKNDLIKSSIIGIGLNVNQTDFVNLPLATSLKNIMGSDYSTEAIMNSIVWQLRKGFELYESGAIDILNKSYESSLFRKDKASTFKKLNEETFTGIIRGITETGKISIEIEDEILKEFAFKEIELLY
jgi:BirA family biotin operon repressor/biotin-[acetyl-CoA-carboxylase] ligase